MFSLVITIISIALVAALALATIYFGGPAYTEATANAQAVKVSNQAQQLLGAAELFYAKNGRWNRDIPELVADEFLKTLPVAQSSAISQALAAGTEWTQPMEEQPVFMLVSMDTEACRSVNQKAYGLRGILPQLHEGYVVQCFGTASNSLATVAARNAQHLNAVAADGSVITAEMLSADAIPDASAGTPVWFFPPNADVGSAPPPPGVAGLSISQNPLAFGSVAANTTVSLQLTLTNSGTAALAFTSAPVLSGDPAYVITQDLCTGLVEPTENCTVTVNYAPTLLGDSAATTLSLQTNAGDEVLVPVTGSAFNPLTLGTAVLPSAARGEAYAPFDFSTLFVASNEAAPTMSGVTWQATGVLPAGMTFDPLTARLAGTPTTSTAPEGAVLTVTATYKGNQAQQTYTLNVGAPVMGLSATSLDFGNVATNTTSSLQLTLNNTGNAPLSLTSVPTLAGAPTYAVLENLCSAPVAPAGNCVITVNYSPTVVGAAVASSLNLKTNAGADVVVPLSATAFNPVTLGAATLPQATQNSAYTPFDFTTLFAASNEASPSLAQVTWNLTGTLPTGMAFNPTTARLSGTPTAPTPASGADFTVTATYKNNQGQQVYAIVVKSIYLEVLQISAGNAHTCAVTVAGGVKCWGFDGSGQLGNDTATVNQPTPVDVFGLGAGSEVKMVSAGASHTCAVLIAGGLKCWGADDYAQLGNPASFSPQRTPVDVANMTTGVSSVSASAEHTCAVMSAGGVKCWGSNYDGKLGNTAAVSAQQTPLDVTGLTNVAEVVTGRYHTCARTTAGGAKCWGADGSGQLGNDASLTRQNAPVDVFGLTSGVTTISSKGSHTCAVASGGVKCWGQDASGQLGDDATLTNQPTPVNALGLTSGVTHVSAGISHTCAVSNGGVKCWGADATGQLGNDATLANQPTPVDVAGLTGVATVSAGNGHTCVMTTVGGAKCWGAGLGGQLGNNVVPVNQTAPVDVLP